MKTTVKTLKGWANNSSFLFSENSNNENFLKNLSEFEKEHPEYKRLRFFESLKGKNVSHKIIIKGWYWLNSWADPQKRTYCIYYK